MDAPNDPLSDRMAAAVAMETRAYRFAGFELDLGVFELRRGGRVVPVGPRGFDVLRYLIEKRDRVVEKEELIGAVWNVTVGESLRGGARPLARGS